MRVEHNINNNFCSCNFEWVVIDEGGYSIFGAYTENECIIYITTHIK